MKLMTTLQEMYDVGMANRDAEEKARFQRLQDAKVRRGVEWTRLSLNLRQATSDEYLAWLRGFVENGGEPTTFEPVSMPTNFYIVNNDINLPSWDEEPVNLIIPKGVEVRHGRLGLNCLFYMEGFTHKGFTVPMYRDSV